MESPYKAAAKLVQRALTQKCSTLQANYHRRFITLQLTGLMNYWHERLQRDAFKRGRRERPEIIFNGVYLSENSRACGLLSGWKF